MNQGKLEVVKQEMSRVNMDILGINELKWIGMGEFNSDDHCIYYQESQFPSRLIRSPGVTKERGVRNSQGGRKYKLFFPLHSLGLCNNNVSCLRTVFGRNQTT